MTTPHTQPRTPSLCRTITAAYRPVAPAATATIAHTAAAARPQGGSSSTAPAQPAAKRHRRPRPSMWSSSPSIA